MGSISFFVPHIGCPVKCSFCNQHSISGRQQPLLASEVETTLEQSAQRHNDKCKDTQIAFFGGSFTAIDLKIQTTLLDTAKYAVEKYGYQGIRFSTRPDAIDEEIMKRLESYPIIAIELGAQSMNDKVLEANNRGHVAYDTVKAAKLIKQAGYELTLQMMVGLYKDSISSVYTTAEEIALLEPHSTRIYPTIVLKNTQLGELYEAGLYKPLTLDETIECCSELLDFFRNKNIKVIKLGLHDETSLRENMLAGPHHPALRELCEGYALAKVVKAKLKEKNTKVGTVYLSRFDYSKLAGHKGFFKKRLENEGYNITILQSKDLEKNGLLII